MRQMRIADGVIANGGCGAGGPGAGREARVRGPRGGRGRRGGRGARGAAARPARHSPAGSSLQSRVAWGNLTPRLPRIPA